MNVEKAPSKLNLEEFVNAFREKLIPLTNQFSWLSSPALAEEDQTHYLQEPIGALPPEVCRYLPPVAIFLVPFLEEVNTKPGAQVSHQPVDLSSYLPACKIKIKETVNLFFAVKEETVSEYHYSFFHQIASLLVRNGPANFQDAFMGVLRKELASKIHGEIGERSWTLKQALLRRPGSRESKAFLAYSKQALEDTLTLYMHGICCDIDVEAGPRQMASLHLRKRLETLQQLFPPPKGLFVFPEQLKRLSAARKTTNATGTH